MAYSSFADTWSIPGRYILFWELKLRDSNTDQLKLDLNTMEQCCRRVEKSLDFTYRGVAPLQYKTSCCLKIKEAIEILDSRVVIGKFFSNGNLA
ncbi:hypothetical protein Goshw_011000 [Gossypium schwendimanii]|uniref:GH3 C-terminal domain-containing protein n=1 Tax=Gossypium schwendimanii TaxID=34291 RepID=A0A7J9M2R8_GOSSC|nr:hypothetical protein [Gossypium schwendimanii]